jgi:glutathione S-transferase
MIVYGVPLSPFVRKVLVYGDERGLALEMKPTRFGQPDPEFDETSPFGKVPGFRDGDFTISDSSAIIAYLEAKFPQGRLIPSDPQSAARVTWFDEFADTVAFPSFSTVFFNRVVAPMVGRPQDLAAADKAQAEGIPPMFDYLESQIDGDYLVGNTLTLADISVGSMLMNLNHCDACADAERYPKVSAYAAKLHARPSFAKWRAVEHKIMGK